MPNVDQKLTRLTYNAMTFVKKLKKALYVYICVGGGGHTQTGVNVKQNMIVNYFQYLFENL